MPEPDVGLDVCEKAPEGYSSHHFIARRDGGTPMNPAYVMTCANCGLTEKQVRERMKERSPGQ